MADQLNEISRERLIDLKNLYLPDGKKSYIAHTTIDNYIRWFQKNRNIKHIKVFSLNDDFSEGTFVITDRCMAYADTFNPNHEKLLRLLKLMYFSKGYFFQSVRSELGPVIKEAILSCSELVNDETTLLYSLRKEEALKFETEPPNGITLRRITELADLNKVDSLWKFPNQTKFEYIKRMAKFNPQIGAYSNDDILVSWIFSAPTGLLAILQTIDEFTGRGFASLVTKRVCRQIAEMGQNIKVGIFGQNTPSRNLFVKDYMDHG